eukprot:3409163-Pyramimonas_sp.AAC.1
MNQLAPPNRSDTAQQQIPDCLANITVAGVVLNGVVMVRMVRRLVVIFRLGVLASSGLNTVVVVGVAIVVF